MLVFPLLEKTRQIQIQGIICVVDIVIIKEFPNSISNQDLFIVPYIGDHIS